MNALVLQIGLVSLVLRSCFGLLACPATPLFDPSVVKESIFRARRSVSVAEQLSCTGVFLLRAPPRIVETLFGAMAAELCSAPILYMPALYTIVSSRSPPHRIALTPLFCFLPACIVPAATEDLRSRKALLLLHCF